MSTSNSTFYKVDVEIPYDEEAGFARWLYADVVDLEGMCKRTFARKPNASFPKDVDAKTEKRLARNARFSFYGTRYSKKQGRQLVFRLEDDETCKDLHHIRISCVSAYVTKAFEAMAKRMIQLSLNFWDGGSNGPYANVFAGECDETFGFLRMVGKLKYKRLDFMFERSFEETYYVSPDGDRIAESDISDYWPPCQEPKTETLTVHPWKEEFMAVGDKDDPDAVVWLCHHRKGLMVQGTNPTACLRIMIRLRELYDAKTAILKSELKAKHKKSSHDKKEAANKAENLEDGVDFYDPENPYTLLSAHGYGKHLVAR